MGCRTRVIGNVYDPTKEISNGRGNLSFTSINLPRIAIEANKNIDWFFKELDSKIDLYYFTGTMQEGALVITPDEAALFVRHSYECAVRDSSFADIRPLGSFRSIASAFPHIPERFTSRRGR